MNLKYTSFSLSKLFRTKIEVMLQCILEFLDAYKPIVGDTKTNL